MVRFAPQGQESIGAIDSWIRKQDAYSEPPFVSTGSEVIDELVEKDP